MKQSKCTQDSLGDLSREEAEALAFLRASLPFGHAVSCPPERLLSMVRHAHEVRALVPWGAAIPEDVFRSFVLFPLVNNEPLEDNRSVFFREIWPRVEGMSMREAVLAVNLWCLEKATYRSTDERTASPQTVVRRAFGRCGEESTLLTCALRAVGIPARQCYAPRWAHCDDNHAWVEAWVDGTWHFLGACEPEPDLDIGWFTAAATRAMLVHTRGFGWRSDSEPLQTRGEMVSLINRTAHYAATRLLQVRVVENGVPRPGIEVRFELANMGELYPIHTQKTDADGKASLETGLGCLHLHAHDGRRFMTAVVDVRETDCITLDFGEASEDTPETVSFDLIPPAEGAVPVRVFNEAVLQRHAERVRQCNDIREAYASTAPKPDGNGMEINAFLAGGRFAAEDKQALLDTLTEKDLADVTAEVLADALEGALQWRGKTDEAIWREAILRPRVEWESLVPVRGYIQRYFAERGMTFADGGAVWAYLQQHIRRIDDKVSQEYAVADARSVLACGMADVRSLDLLYVSVCRAFGIAARLNPVTGAKEYYSGTAFVSVENIGGQAKLTLLPAQQGVLEYGVHFTVGYMRGGSFHTLRLQGLTLEEPCTLDVPAGLYRLLTCARQIDGTVLVRATHVRIAAGDEATICPSLRDANMAERLLRVPLSHPALDTLMPLLEGRDAALLFIAPGQEPTEHLLGELAALSERIASLDIRLLLVMGEQDAANATLTTMLDSVPQSKLLQKENSALQEYLRRALRMGDPRLPLAVALRRDGMGLFAFGNYGVGMGESLLNVLEAGR